MFAGKAAAFLLFLAVFAAACLGPVNGKKGMYRTAEEGPPVNMQTEHQERLISKKKTSRKTRTGILRPHHRRAVPVVS
jgi:hypothetical protein